MTDIKTELPKPWGYARNVDGRIQISVGPDRPPCNERGGGYFTPWAAMYGGDMMIAYAERAVLEAAPASSAMAMQAVDAQDAIDAHRYRTICELDGGSIYALLGEYDGMRREIIDKIIDALSQQSPVQAIENFCSRCGKRNYAGSIHTCTPPIDSVQASEPENDAARRYEIVRKLSVPEFAELYRRNIAGEGRFDDLVDQLGKQASYAGRQG